uniref:Uncharacterized protein n=1 Tax=Panagrolaimus sp. ES5 TaxID=591445 RepID=A0AC34F3C3_9BILA
MRLGNIICVLVVFIAEAFAAKSKMVKLGCTKLRAKEARPKITFDTLLEAHKACVKDGRCSGLRMNAENQFQLLIDLKGYDVAEWDNDYILDFSNYTRFVNAPSKKDTYVLYGIYRNGTCPFSSTKFIVFEGKCRHINFSEVSCKSYASFMEPKWDAAGSVCTVLTKESIIEAWS